MEDDRNLPETILYELICCGEWRDEREEQVSQLLPDTTAAGLLSFLNPSKLLKKRQLSIPESVRWLKGIGPPWQVSISPDGNVAAILQNSVLETRSSRDNFSTTLGRTVVLKDPNFLFRLMAWSVDSSMLAISFSNGQIIFYDTLASQLSSVRRCALPSQEDLPAATFSTENTLAGLFFSSERVKKCSYTNELISVDSKGFIKCFRQTSADQMTFHHDSSVRRYYPKGVYSASYVEKHGVVIITGPLESDSATEPQKEASHNYGITVWRLMNDTPYYKILFNVSNDEFSMDTRRRWRFAVSALFPDSTKCDDVIFKLTLSPNEKHVAALHTSGCISVWHLPSLTLFRKWPLKNQFHHWTENTRFNNRWRVAFNRWNTESVDNWRFHPRDLNWWNDEILIISRVNGCVSLCLVSEEYPTKNLLGDSPEVFESPVAVTTRKGKGFFALECELRLKVEERRDVNGDLIETSEAAGIELLDAYDAQFLPKTIAQEVLFWITDFERFRPPRKRKRKPPVWKETHRLFLVRNITPQELFHQKIEAEEYGEALDLARAYKLDADLVYQRQWSKSPVSIHTIRDYLGKIKKRNWVLQECLERVPENADAARELLGFGLKGTDITAAVMISQGKDKGMFHMLTPDDLDISQEEYLLLIDGDNLEVKRLLSYRKQFLYYIDMLDTYELMVGGPRMVDENFDGKVYAKLRIKSPVESAVEMARSSDVAALRIMLTHHWFEIAPQYLTVISSFPETTCPHDYRDFLPEIDEDGEVLLWDEYIPKERDWCERFLETGLKLRRASAGSLDTEASTDQIVAWYEERVHEIERLSGITSHALDLARLGVQRKVPELDTLVKDLEVVEIMVYDAKVDVTLEKLEELCPIDRLQILMSNTDEKNFIGHIRDYVMPFLEKCELQEKGTRYHLFDQYLSSISVHNLAKSLQVFENSTPGCSDPLISDISELMRMAYNCIYACTNSKQIDNILAILNCLPERHRGIVNNDLKPLHDAIDDLELHYQGVKILDKYGICISLQELKEKTLNNETDEDEEMEKYFEKICDSPRWVKPPMKLNDWKLLLYDVLDLQKKVFKNFPMEKCFELYVGALLRSGSAEVISLARDFIDHQLPDSPEDTGKENTSTNNFQSLIRRVSSAYSTAFALYLYLIPYNKSLEMILSAAQHYFDSASNYADPDIKLCKVCLNLIQNPKESEISEMFDFIDAVKIINKDFQLMILPQTVRLSRDKVKLIRQTMENIPDGYKKTQQLLKLAIFLKLDDNMLPELESWVLDMCGNAALEESDMKFCAQICANIIAKGYQTGWKVFTQTAKYQSDPPVLDHETRLAFINYALNMCPEDEILNVLNSKYLIEIRSLQSRISELSPQNSVLDSSLLDVPETDNELPDKLNPAKLKEFLSTTTSWISPLKDVAQVVMTGTGTLLNPSKIAGITSRFLADSLHEHDMSSSICLNSDENDPNTGFIVESYPTFYLNQSQLNSGQFHQSLLAFKYNSFSSSSASYYISSNPALELCVTLNRIWHLERCLLGEEECESRNESVVEQLVTQILPEDLPWGLAILFSIESPQILTTVLSQIPKTPISLTVILYFLSLAISKQIGRLENTITKDPNLVVEETELFVQVFQSDDEESILSEYVEQFTSYKEKLQNLLLLY